MSANDACVCYVTCANEDAAHQLARQLVEERLAACVNVIHPVRSFYRWQDKLCDEPETLCLVKTRLAAFARLRRRILELHTYEVPEIVAVPLVAGHGPYLDWLRAQVDIDPPTA